LARVGVYSMFLAVTAVESITVARRKDFEMNGPVERVELLAVSERIKEEYFGDLFRVIDLHFPSGAFAQFADRLCWRNIGLVGVTLNQLED